MPKYAQTTTQLHSFLMQVRLHSKPPELHFSMKWATLHSVQYVNWELPEYKLGLEKAEEPEIKLSTFVGS